MPGKPFFALALAAACMAQNASKLEKPMITPNPDGTFTAQKQPKQAKPKALVIPKQVVVPFVTKKPARQTVNGFTGRTGRT